MAAAAYLMKHTGTTALIVTDAKTGQPVGIINEADISHAITDRKDLNDVRVHAVMTPRPATAAKPSTTSAVRIRRQQPTA